MADFKLSRKASSDLGRIWDYTVNNWSEEQAIKYYKSIATAIQSLSGLPEYLTTSYNTVTKGLRGYHIGHHVIFFRVTVDGTILVSRILYERMDFKRHLSHDNT